MRTVYVTTGYADTITTDVADTEGTADLQLATIKSALIPEADGPPAAGSVLWQTPTVSGAGAAAVATVGVPTGTTPGYYHLGLQINIGGLPVFVWAMDPDRPENRLLVRVI